MTIERAIKILERMQEPEAWEPAITPETFEALQMACTALKGFGRAEQFRANDSAGNRPVQGLRVVWAPTFLSQLRLLWIR